MNFLQRMELVASTPTPRPHTCVCGPWLGDWTEGCPEHPMDDEAAVYFAAIRQIQNEHTAACIDHACDVTATLGCFNDVVVDQAAAQALDDGDVDCVCAATKEKP